MKATPAYSTLLFDVSDAVARITFNRPHARNSIDPVMALEFYDAVKRVADNAGIRVLVVRGMGKDFCCGADLRTPAKNGDEDLLARQAMQTDLAFFNVTVLLHEMQAVTIAAITGGCAGAGMGWACACDLQIADTTARFNTAFLDVGVAGDMAVPWFLPRLVGAGRARDLLLFPRKVDAPEALSIGLVSRVYAPDAFDDALQGLVDRLANFAPLALKAMKANFMEAERLGLASFVMLEAVRHMGIFKSEDTQEAFTAFAEKRVPQFKGR